MKQIKTYGSLHPTYSFKEQVSVSTDSIQYDINSKYKVLVQLEPPEVTNYLDIIINNHHKFDLILTWNEKILNKCPNSKKFPFGCCWIDLDTFVGDKKNEISFITSNKSFTPGHKLRHEIYNMLKNYKHNKFTINSVMTPPRIVNKHPLFTHAKYSIIVENAQHPNWFTEKLIDCLATKTVPIYYGCSNIGEYFNTDGFFIFNNMEELMNILENISEEEYSELQDIIESNYNESFKYHDFHKRVEGEINNLIKR